MMHDALGAHARDELGRSEVTSARPLLAAVTSAASFTSGAVLPLAVTAISPPVYVLPAVACTALFSLSLLGTLAAKAGGAKMFPGAARIAFWSALAMTVSAGVGMLFGQSV